MTSTPPILVYDGDCGFCTRSVRLAARLPAGLSYRPWQATDLAALGITEDRARREVILVDAKHRVYGGAAAVAALLRHCRGAWPVLGLLLAAPGVRAVAARLYRRIADNRYRLPGATPACRLPPERRPG
ncbi:thiol-disulfide oxidoreductase DCC family protein [Marinactinospora rubrisoli]|uniref:Thiol-disulfide oxidoreductase DCC family protein n=1 Tax=Marinactinospora rubrisoli TaxID=2715399 RepID=A0ABW2KDQ8_9ACTN